jgi:nucleoside triphosphate pyrophosphatase
MQRPRKTRLILASASPRRAEILRDAGFDFEVRPSAVDESLRAGESPAAHVERLAREKALAVAATEGPGIIIAADTVVVAKRKILGKPKSRADARRMLRILSGRSHQVLTGIAILRFVQPRGMNPKVRVGLLSSAVESTRVTFARLNRREIESYIASGEPDDKAGAYAVQGRGGRFVTRIEGCYFNVVGLPLARLYRMLLNLGISEGASKHKRRPEPSGRRKKN